MSRVTKLRFRNLGRGWAFAMKRASDWKWERNGRVRRLHLGKDMDGSIVIWRLIVGPMAFWLGHDRGWAERYGEG